MPFYGNGPILFQDEFTYSDGLLSSVGSAKWTNGFWTGQPSLRVLSNKAAGPANNSWSDNYTKTSYSIGDTGIEMIWKNITRGTSVGTWCYNHILGVAAGSPSGYWMRWAGRPNMFYAAGRLTNGSFVDLITTSVLPANGDDICLQILPGGIMSLFRKPSGGSWGQIGSTVTDTSRTSGVIALESAMNGDRWDSVELRSVPGPGGMLKHWTGTEWASAVIKAGASWNETELKLP